MGVQLPFSPPKNQKGRHAPQKKKGPGSPPPQKKGQRPRRGGGAAHACAWCVAQPVGEQWCRWLVARGGLCVYASPWDRGGRGLPKKTRKDPTRKGGLDTQTDPRAPTRFQGAHGLWCVCVGSCAWPWGACVSVWVGVWVCERQGGGGGAARRAPQEKEGWTHSGQTHAHTPHHTGGVMCACVWGVGGCVLVMGACGGGG